MRGCAARAGGEQVLAGLLTRLETTDDTRLAVLKVYEGVSLNPQSTSNRAPIDSLQT